MELSDKEIEFCRSWCKAHATKWQVQRRGKWTYRWHGKTLIRYVDAAQMRENEVKALLEYLTDPACIETLSLYDQAVDAEWTPVNAWYDREPYKANGNVGSVRLFHALKTDVEDGAGDGPYVVENGCAYTVSWTYYWKQTSVIKVPDGTSGVQYRIVNLSRDDEDGTYTYALERRERVQQDVPEYTSEKDSFKEVRREEHKGVKGGVGVGGKAASVSKGKLVARTVQKDDDCTHDVLNVTTESEEVRDAVVTTMVGENGTVVEKVNRNMREKATADGLDVGESVTNKQNEDLTWDQTIRTYSREAWNWLRGVCRRTIYRHVDERSEVSGEKPTELGAGEEMHVISPSEAPGKMHELDIQKVEGGWRKTETTTEDQPVSEAATETRVGLDGMVETTRNRNQAEPAPTVGLGIGESVTNEKTESGLYDQTIVKPSSTDTGKVGEHCEDSALAHTHGSTEVLGRDSESLPESYEVEAQPGQIAVMRMERTGSGGFHIVRETRTAKARNASTAGGTVSRLVHSESFRNADAIEPQMPMQNEEIDATASPNESGKFDGTVRVTKHFPHSTSARTENFFFTETTEVTANDTDVNPSAPFAEGEVVDISASPTGMMSANVTKRKRIATPREWDVEVSSETAYHRTQYFRNVTKDRYKKLVKSMQGEVDDKVKSWIREGRPPSRSMVSPSIQANELGRYDGYVSMEVSWAAGSAGQTGETDELIFEKRIETYSGGVKIGDQIFVQGRGKNMFREKLDQWTTNWSSGVRRSPHFRYSYNENTCTWDFMFGVGV